MTRTNLRTTIAIAWMALAWTGLEPLGFGSEPEYPLLNAAGRYFGVGWSHHTYHNQVSGPVHAPAAIHSYSSLAAHSVRPYAGSSHCVGCSPDGFTVPPQTHWPPPYFSNNSSATFFPPAIPPIVVHGTIAGSHGPKTIIEPVRRPPVETLPSPRQPVNASGFPIAPSEILEPESPSDRNKLSPSADESTWIDLGPPPSQSTLNQTRGRIYTAMTVPESWNR